MKHSRAFSIILLVLAACSQDNPYPVYDEGEIIWQVTDNPNARYNIREFIITPDGKQVVLTRNNGINTSLIKYDLASGIESFIHGPGYSLDISPNGIWLVFVSAEGISKIKLNGDSLNLLPVQSATGIKQPNYFPRWRPDGNAIMYFHYFNDSMNPKGLYVLRADNSNEFITAIPGYLLDFFPDGKRVITVKNNKFLIYNLETSEQNEIDPHHEESLYESLTVSPDGKKILYSSLDGIFIMESDGSNEHLILPRIVSYRLIFNSVGFKATYPTWHPDGKHILYNHLAITEEVPCGNGDACSERLFIGITSIRKLRVLD